MPPSDPDDALRTVPPVADAAVLALAESVEAPSAAGSRHAGILLAAAVLLIAFNLRTAVASIGPVLRDVVQATAMSGPGASLLTTVPSLCFGLFGPLAPRLARRYGTEATLAAMLVLLTAGTALRGLASVWSLFLGQILACAAIGIVNVLLPSLVKRDFRDHAAVMTGFYTTAFCIGAAVAAGATVPLRQALGGSWGSPLAFWALPVAVALAAWLALMPCQPAAAGRARVPMAALLRDALAWQLTLFMGLQSALAYIVFGWLVPILRDRGLSPVDAGLVLSASVLTQALACMAVPWLATRGRDQRLAAVAVAAITAAGLMGCLYAPLATVWAWTLVLGFGQGGTVSLALTLIVLRAPSAPVAASLSGMCQSIGYLLASGGPLLAGLLHDWTGTWNAVAVFCLVLAGLLAACGLGAGRAQHVRARGGPAEV